MGRLRLDYDPKRNRFAFPMGVELAGYTEALATPRMFIPRAPDEPRVVIV